MYNFTFYFLIFLNFFQLILSTNPPCKFILDKMEKFQEEFVSKFEELEQKLKENGGKEAMGQIFDNAMFKKEFPSEIVRAKKEVEKFLRGKRSFHEIYYNPLEHFKLQPKKMEALKKHREELEAQNVQKHMDLDREMSNNHPNQSQEEKQLELIDSLINLREFTNKFIDDLIVELYIRQPIKYFIELGELIQQQNHNAQFSAPFENFLTKYSKKSFWKVEYIIKLQKQALRHNYDMQMPPTQISPGILEVFEDMPMLIKLPENKGKLMKAFVSANPLLEKVELNIPPANFFLPPSMKEIQDYYGKIKESIDKVVDDLPKMIDDDFFMENQKEFANLHAEFYDFLSLSIASNKIFNRIWIILNMMPMDPIQQYIILADIHWLAKFIKENLAKVNAGQILNSTMAKEKEELPKELALYHREMDPKRMAIFIAKNLLYIAAQIDKIHNFKNSIHITNLVYPIDCKEDARIYQIVLKELPPKSIGQFFYKKYVEKIENGKYDELSKVMKKRKIGESWTKDEYGPGSSSTRIGGEEIKEKKVRKVEENEE